MHISFESLIVINILGLQVFFMDIHHNTSLKSILKNDSISLAFGVRIQFCSNKGTRLWLIFKSSFCSFALHILLSFQH
jgi:hypothetical protein